MTEQQIPKLTGLLVEHQKSFETLSAKDGQWAIQNITEAISLFEKAVRTRITETPPIISPVATKITVPTTDACRVKDCFCNASVFSYRDPDLDRWLIGILPKVLKGGNGINYKLMSKGSDFRGMARAILGEATDNYTKLAMQLVNGKKTFSLKQIEDIHVQFGRAENRTNLLVNGCANFFFTHDKNREVFIVHTNLDAEGWRVTIYRFEGGGKWDTGNQLFVRN